MIAASLFLVIALYFSAVVVIQTASGIAFKQARELEAQTFSACLAWGAFYYFTHAA